MGRKIIVIGSSNTDMVIKAEKLPGPGETILGGRFLMNPGGKGANQAVAAALLGSSVTFVCKTGQDLFGKQALNDFRSKGINTDFVYADEENPSGVALILVDAKGENSIAVAPGANAHLSVEEVKQALEIIEEGDLVLIQLEIPLPVVEFAIRESHAKGARVILNPAPAQHLDDTLYKYVIVITPNESEAEVLTGVRVSDTVSAEKAAGILFEKGIEHIIITMGSKGAYLFNKENSKLIPCPVVEALDTTAAGDVFNGALAAGLAEDKNMEESVDFACYAASISVTRMGAQASAPYRAEVADLMKRADP